MEWSKLHKQLFQLELALQYSVVYTNTIISLILLFLEQHHSTWTDDTTYKKTTIHLYSCFIAVATNTEMDK